MEQDALSRLRRKSPFDGSAFERLQRMGLLFADGRPDKDAAVILACVYAGQYFDDLCEFCQDTKTAQDILKQFIAEAASASPQHRFVLLCLQYDAIYRPLPDPVWWISGNAELADVFSSRFAARLEQLQEEGV